MGDRLVQTRLPPTLFAEVEKRASREGESVASWLRRLVFRALDEGPVLDAWILPEGVLPGTGQTSTCKLLPIGIATATERLFVVLAADGGPLLSLPVRPRSVVVLQGSRTHWEIVSQLELGGRLQLGLRSRGTFF